MGSIVSPRSRNAATGDAQSEFDAATGETLVRMSAVILDEDFIGPGHTTIPAAASPATGYPWVQKVVKTGGSPSLAIIANSSAGIVRGALDATSEKQEATIYANDSLNWDMTKSAIFECRAAFHVLPSAAGVEIVFGLHSAWIDGPDNASFYADFQANGSGLINFRTKDGVNTKSNPSTLTTVVDAFHNFRIDATDPTNVLFFIDNVQQNTPGQMTFAATGANAILQPYFTVYKPSGTGVGTFDLDMVQVAMNRS